MKILILGASGMLGHMVSYYFKKKYHSDTIFCSRSKTNVAILDKTLIKISEYSQKQLSILIEKNRPCKIINCVSINNVNENQEKLNLVNSELPKLLANILDKKNDGSQLIHISTNGVFDGTKGNYIETDKPEPISVYGKSKLNGEVIHSPHATIRTSVIGSQLKSNDGLLSWFLKQNDQINGYTEVQWNGVTTLECAKFIDWLIEKKLSGLIHLFSKKISKYDLLNIMKNIYQKSIKINPNNSIKSDLTLGTIRSDINYSAPSHSEMLKELKNVSFSNF